MIRNDAVKLGHPPLAAPSLLIQRPLLARAGRGLEDGMDEGAAFAMAATGTEPVRETRLAEPTPLFRDAGDLTRDVQGLERQRHVDLLLGRVRAAAAEAAQAARLLDELSRSAGRGVPRACADLPAQLRPPPDHGLVGTAPALLRVVRALTPVARSGATVLVRGESGTGKEIVARAIHERSARSAMPYVKVNCAAMVEDLLLSELFGHERGAFTGAVRERRGRFELAEGGTIFFDEIGDLSPGAQTALLRVLQEREFERVGGQRTLRADVRVICATNRDLEAMIARGQFREDLYYRIKEVMLRLPPLRERPGDIPELCRHLLDRIARDRREEPKAVSPEVMSLLEGHAWPGNVRELEHILSCASIFADASVIGLAAIESVGELALLSQEPAARRGEARGAPAAPTDLYDLARCRGLSLRELQAEIEETCVERALADSRGNISGAARLLGMKRSRLSQIVNASHRLRAAADTAGQPALPRKRLEMPPRGAVAPRGTIGLRCGPAAG